MAISLTDSAADRVKSFLATRGHGIGLRLGVRKTGCSGFAYVINYADGPEAGDAVFEDRGVQVFVDTASLGLLDGTIVDFVKQGLQRGIPLPQPEREGRMRLRRELLGLISRAAESVHSATCKKALSNGHFRPVLHCPGSARRKVHFAAGSRPGSPAAEAIPVTS